MVLWGMKSTYVDVEKIIIIRSARSSINKVFSLNNLRVML